uniref:Uncharacterized protein n=1 Tax=Daphnia magna TaxID=35525 RepID=A0A0N8EL73_9CRUS
MKRNKKMVTNFKNIKLILFYAVHVNDTINYHGIDWTSLGKHPTQRLIKSVRKNKTHTKKMDVNCSMPRRKDLGFVSHLYYPTYEGVIIA